MADLQSLIRQQFQLEARIGTMCCVVAGIMIKAGIDTRILNLPKDGALDDCNPAPPIVYGEVKMKRKTNAR